MSKRKQKASNSTWRSIQQAGLRLSASKEGAKRQRRRVNRPLIILGVYLLIIGVSTSIYFIAQSEVLNKNTVVRSEAYELQFETDGVLEKAFVVEYLNLSEATDLMNVDIFGVKKRLESLSQIKSVHVERLFPRTLALFVSEYQPIAKMGVAEGGVKQVLYVSAEGNLFSLSGDYDELAFHLPFLTGVKLVREGKDFLPIQGAAAITNFLEKARRNKPHLYNQWKIVSLKNETLFDDQGTLIFNVTSENAGKLIFSSREIEMQLEKIDFIIKDIESRNIGPIKSIDLSMGDQVAVQLQNSNFKASF